MKTKINKSVKQRKKPNKTNETKSSQKTQGVPFCVGQLLLDMGPNLDISVLDMPGDTTFKKKKLISPCQ